MSEKDVQITYGTGFEALLKVLAEVKRPGNHCASGTVETPMPTIEVAPVGMLSFPVPAAQARDLIERAAERAPYGRGAKTLVDEAVRKVWQVPAEKTRISGKGWAASLAELVDKVAEELGCEDAAVEAEFYKLLVYDEGGFFLPHRDSEKSGGMFGTLVITLPSRHEGGELVIRHAGRETVLDLRGEAPSEIQYAAFYADCEHEVRPVRSGYRVCLIYNLVQRKKKGRLQPPDHRPAIAEAAPLLAQWAGRPAGRGDGEKIVYLLEHHYTQAALAFSALKGADAALAQVLVPAAAEAKCMVHLGIVHIEESGWAEYEGGGGGYYRRRGRWDDDEVDDEDDYTVGEVCDGRYFIDQWRTPDDAVVEFGEIPLGKGEVLPPGALDGEAPDESHFSEATGNAGAEFERTYLRAALVIWPEDRFDQICVSAGPDAVLARLELLVKKAKRSTGTERTAAEKGVRRLAKALTREADADGDWEEDRGEGSGEIRDRLSRLIEILTEFGDARLLLDTVEVRLLEDYDGRQNRALLAALPVLGEAAAADLLTGIAEANGEESPAAVMILWTMLATSGAVGATLLARVLGAWIEAIGHYTPPRVPGETGRLSDYVRAEIEAMKRVGNPGGAHALSPGNVAEFLRRLHRSPCAGKMGEVVRGMAAKPDLFVPETVVLPALEMLGGEVPAQGGPADLWAHCARYYLQRSERPPEPPRDWAQDVRLSGGSPVIRELEKFARDPQAKEHRFRVRKELRQEIHRAIENAGLDMTHVTDRKGSPQTLVCTKTRGAYERARRRYESDRAHLRRLLGLFAIAKVVDADLVARVDRASGDR